MRQTNGGFASPVKGAHFAFTYQTSGAFQPGPTTGAEIWWLTPGQILTIWWTNHGVAWDNPILVLDNVGGGNTLGRLDATLTTNNFANGGQRLYPMIATIASSLPIALNCTSIPFAVGLQMGGASAQGTLDVYVSVQQY